MVHKGQCFNHGAENVPEDPTGASERSSRADQAVNGTADNRSRTEGAKRNYNTKAANSRGRKLSRHRKGQKKSSVTYAAAKAAVGVPTSTYPVVRSAIAAAQPNPYSRRRKTPDLTHVEPRSPTKRKLSIVSVKIAGVTCVVLGQTLWKRRPMNF